MIRSVRWILFGLGLVAGVIGLKVLFTQPDERSLWFSFLMSASCLMTLRPSSASTQDVSKAALIGAFGAVALIFALFLIPLPHTPPLWARIGAAAIWMAVTGYGVVRVFRSAEAH